MPLASWLINFFRYSTRRYLDQRTWRQRLTRKCQNWDPVIPSLMESYADWKYGPSTTHSPSPMEVDSSTVTPPSGTHDFSLPVLDIYTLDTSITIPCSGEELPIAALIKNGYLGNTPVTPSLAISLKTLELFRRIRLRKSSFSVEAFVKVVCDLYAIRTHSSWGPSTPADIAHFQVPYHRRYRSSLSDAFEIYVIILRSIERRVAQELGRDSPDWRVKHACPPCTYEECTSG